MIITLERPSLLVTKSGHQSTTTFNLAAGSPWPTMLTATKQSDSLNWHPGPEKLPKSSVPSLAHLPPPFKQDDKLQ